MRPDLPWSVWRQQQFDAQGGLCWWCKQPMNFYGSPDHPLFASREHLKPRSQGGTNDPENLRLAHKRCNNKRGSGEWDSSVTIAEQTDELTAENYVRRFLGFPPLKK